MSAPISRTVRLPLNLLEHAERVRAAVAARAGVEVDLRAVMERAVRDGLAAAEQRLGRPGAETEAA